MSLLADCFREQMKKSKDYRMSSEAEFDVAYPTGFLALDFLNGTMIHVQSNEKNYKYNTDLVDNSKNSTYLKASYYNQNFPKKYIRGEYRFANQFSKDYILQNYPTLKINKIIKENIAITPSFKEQEKEIDEENLKLLKQRLIMQYFG